MVVAIVAAKCFGFDKAGKAYWKQNWGRGAGSLNLIEEWAKDAWINQRRKRTGVCISFVVDVFRVQTFNLGEWAKHISKQVQTRSVLGLRLKTEDSSLGDLVTGCDPRDIKQQLLFLQCFWDSAPGTYFWSNSLWTFLVCNTDCV